MAGDDPGSEGDLLALSEPVRTRFLARHEARETAYQASRETVRVIDRERPG